MQIFHISANRLEKTVVKRKGFQVFEDVGQAKRKKGKKKAYTKSLKTANKKQLVWRLFDGLPYNCLEDKKKVLDEEYNSEASKKFKICGSVYVDEKYSLSLGKYPFRISSRLQKFLKPNIEAALHFIQIIRKFLIVFQQMFQNA